MIAIGDAGRDVGAGANINTVWYENPGPANLGSAWTRRPVYGAFVSNESPAYVNLVGDARRELVFMTSGQLGYAQRGATATAAWTFTAASSGVTVQHAVRARPGRGGRRRRHAARHPRAFGLVAADGDRNLRTPGLRLRHGSARPADRATGAAPRCTSSTSTATATATWSPGSPRTSTACPGSNVRARATAITFVPHAILPSAAGANNFSQLHALAVADVNGDGPPDVIAGKRYYAHPSTNPDPGTTDAARDLLVRAAARGAGATFVQHVIHSDSGAGCNFVARDLTGDGKVDIFTTNKHGTFLHVQN